MRVGVVLFGVALLAKWAVLLVWALSNGDTWMLLPATVAVVLFLVFFRWARCRAEQLGVWK